MWHATEPQSIAVQSAKNHFAFSRILRLSAKVFLKSSERSAKKSWRKARAIFFSTEVSIHSRLKIK